MNKPTVQIKDIAVHFPVGILTNEDLKRDRPTWDMDRVEARAGVRARHIAAPDETALDLALCACRSLFERHPGLAEAVDGILFCTQSGDYIMPPNSCVLHRELNLPDGVFALDTNLACSGYVYGLALAQGLITAGTCHDVLLVTADTYSKYIHPEDRASRTLFGDGAAVSWIGPSAGKTGLIDLVCETSGKGFEKFYIPAGGMRRPRSPETGRETTDSNGNTRTLEQIHMDGMGVLSFVNSKVPGQIHRLLARNQLEVADIELFIFHQASKMALDSLSRALKIPASKVFRNMEEIGNTVSASIPMSLAEARASQRIPAGSKVVLCGFGVGLSWASALVQA